jgi:predicted permease
MKRLTQLYKMIQSFFQKRKLEERLSAELRFHLDCEIEKNLQAGMNSEEARNAALREFGGVEQTKEKCRDSWGLRWLESLKKDLIFGCRQLIKHPGFSIVAVLTMALGIGANTAMFSVLNAALLRPLSWKESNRLVWITEFFPESNRSTVLTPEYASWQQQNNSFEQLGAFNITRGINLTDGNRPERVMAGHVTPNLFSILGIAPVLGRGFLPKESMPGQDRVALLSYELWQNYFFQEPGVVGKTVWLDGSACTVIGIMPRGFAYPESPERGLWLPDAIRPGAEIPGKGMGFVRVIGRLKSGVTPEKGRADLEVISRRMVNGYPPRWTSRLADAQVRVTALRNQMTHEFQPAIFLLLGAVALILLIACANVANLMLARAVTRERELALRAAMGASRGRLVQMLLMESVLVSGLGGVVGVVLATRGAVALKFLLPGTLAGQIPLDWRVLGFTMACSLVTGIFFGLIPALTVSKFDLNRRLKEGGSQLSEPRVHHRFRSSMAVCQLALSLVLLVGAGLMIRSFLILSKVNPGFDSQNVLIADLWLAPLELYDPPHQAAFFQKALEEIQRLPGLENVAVTSAPPLSEFNSVASGLRAEGHPESDAIVCTTSVSPEYFRTLRIPLLQGRYFDERDTQRKQRVAILNQTLARTLFNHEDPIGRQIDLDGWVTVVGVVQDIRHRALDDKVWPELFQSYWQSPSPVMTLMVRSKSDPLQQVVAISKVIQDIDRNLPLADAGTLEEHRSDSLVQRRERMLLLGAFAIMALLIGMIGVYGVMAYSVSRRTQEIGIRMALGARSEDVFKMILSQGIFVALLGVSLGLVGSLVLTRLLSGFLYGVTPTDRLTFAVASLGLAAATLLACYLPARRATRVDPIVALRSE